MYQGIYRFATKFVDSHRNACNYGWIQRLTDGPTDLIGSINQFLNLTSNDSMCEWINRFVSDLKDLWMHY